jgi:hypothetical protein
MKVCTRCREEKDISEFGPNQATKDGFDYYCRQCAREKGAEYHAANKERRNASKRTQRARDIENTRFRKRYQSDSEFRRKVQEKNRIHYQKNYERYRKRNNARIVDWTTIERKAHSKVNKLVGAGKFPPAWTMACDHCQEAQAAVWHHHKGYEGENVTDVISLCHVCHGKVHWNES